MQGKDIKFLAAMYINIAFHKHAQMPGATRTPHGKTQQPTAVARHSPSQLWPVARCSSPQLWSCAKTQQPTAVTCGNNTRCPALSPTSRIVREAFNDAPAAQIALKTVSSLPSFLQSYEFGLLAQSTLQVMDRLSLHAEAVVGKQVGD